MRVAILKNCFKPGEAKTRQILKRDSIQELTEKEGAELIEKGYAAELKPEKPAKSVTPDETWTVAELKKYAEEKGIDLGESKSKADILAAFTA
jgi:hypothetical protein